LTDGLAELGTAHDGQRLKVGKIGYEWGKRIVVENEIV